MTVLGVGEYVYRQEGCERRCAERETRGAGREPPARAPRLPNTGLVLNYFAAGLTRRAATAESPRASAMALPIPIRLSPGVTRVKNVPCGAYNVWPWALRARIDGGLPQ